MTLVIPPPLKALVLATAMIFVSVAVYIYAFGFLGWVESDVCTIVMVASKAIHAKLPVVPDWYYANGDIWFLYYHLIAIPFVAVLGAGIPALLVTVITSFVLESIVYMKLYARLAGNRWLAVFSMMLTMMAWSRAHIEFVYIQLAYGFLTCLFLLSFTTFASIAEAAAVRRSRWLLAGFLVALIGVQNPPRTLVFIVVPVLAACAWPWENLDRQRRLRIAAASVAGWIPAFLIYRFVFLRFVTLSNPPGHTAFHLANGAGISRNLSYIAHGLGILSGGEELSALSIPGLFLMLGGVVLLAREVLSSRRLDAMRFVCVIVLAQFAGVLMLVVFGNLLTDPESIRYLMPSLMGVLGLAAIVAMRTQASARRPWRQLAIAWLVAVPITALIAMKEARPPTPVAYVWPDSHETGRIADELVKRKLTHGYANVLSATMITVQTGMYAQTCPIWFRDHIIKQRWLTDTSCYDADKLPDRFFVVIDKTDHDRKALAASLPPATETFSVGPRYEVHVFPTAGTDLSWLDLPLPDNDKSAFPLRIKATHLQLQRGAVVQESGRMVATGQTGPIMYGPYVTLPRGRYIVHWFGSGIASPGEIKLYVSAGGKTKLVETSVIAANIPTSPGEIGKVAFKLQGPTEAIELVAYSQDGGRVALDELLIERH